MTARRIAIAACATAAVFLALAVSPLAQTVGVTGAVNPNTTGTPPGGTVRELGAGNDVVFNERVTTQATGQAEVLFIDRSALTIGPNSDLVIDEFVYSPETGTGKLAASMSKGVFRFVGGALSKNPDAVTIKTPAAIVGIRGGVGMGVNNPDGGVTLYFLFGEEASLTTSSGRATLHRRGWSITALPGGGFSNPQPADPAVLQGLLKLLTGQPGGNGGASPPPTEQGLAGGPSVDLSIDDDVDANKADLRNFGWPQLDTDQTEKLFKTRQPTPKIIIRCTNCG